MHKLTFILLGVFVILATTSAEKEEKQVQSKSSSELQREVREAERNENKQKNLDRKAKRKNKRKERKRNNRKKNAKKNTKKGRRKNLKAAGRRTAGGRASTTVSETCFFQAMKMMKIWKDNIGNFEKQENRMKIHNKTSGNKSGKKGLFGPVVQRIIEAGGGNRSNMSCAGTYGNAGAKQLTNLTKVLHQCETNIYAACSPSNIPQPNQTTIDYCKGLVSTFKTKAKTCIKEKTNSTAACACWTDSALNASATALATDKCKIQSEQAAITKALRLCTGNFSVCRKYEDDSITAIMSCQKSTNQLLVKAKTLTANKAGLESAKTKMQSLANTTRGNVQRANAASCADVITKSKLLTTMATNSPTAKAIATIAKEIANAGSIKCSSTEVTSLKVQVTSITASITIVTVSLQTVQTNLQTLTGSTASSSEIASATESAATTSAATTATAVSMAMSTKATAAGRRARFVWDGINKKVV